MLLSKVTGPLACLVDGNSTAKARWATHQKLHLPCRDADEAWVVWEGDWLKGRGVLALYWSLFWHRVKNKLAASSASMLGQMMCEAAWWCLGLGWSPVYLRRLTGKQDDTITKLSWASWVHQKKKKKKKKEAKHRARNDCNCPCEGALHQCYFGL